MVRPEGEPAPPAILNAVKLMYAGAAVNIIGIVIGLATAGDLKNAIRKAQPKLTPAQVTNSEHFLVSATVIIGLIGAALWLWMAWANMHGKSWARILSSVFFGVATLNTAASFARARRPAEQDSHRSRCGWSASARSFCSGAPTPAPTTRPQRGQPG